jgi:plasmid stabilization system protein ParE
MLKVIYHPDAEAELLEAVPFYSSREDGGEDPFLAVINHHICEIATAPERFPKVGRDVRRCVVRKYPFIIFFKDRPDHVRVLAIAHTSRRPEYWRPRA